MSIWVLVVKIHHFSETIRDQTDEVRQGETSETRSASG